MLLTRHIHKSTIPDMARQQKTPPDLVSRVVAAETVGVHPNTLRNWAQAGKLTEYEQPGNPRTLVSLSAVEALMTPKVKR